MATLKAKIIAIGSVIAGLIGLVFFFKRKADNAETAAILGETKGQDKELQAAEKLIQDEIEKVKNQDDSKLDDQTRADRWGD